MYCFGADRKVNRLPKRKTTVRGYCCGRLHTALAFNISCVESFSSLSFLFDITLNPTVQILIEYENVYLMTSKQISCAADESSRKTQRGKSILEIISLRPVKTFRRFKPYIPKKVSMLSGGLFVSTAGCVATEGKEGDVFHFGIKPRLNAVLQIFIEIK